MKTSLYGYYICVILQSSSDASNAFNQKSSEESSDANFAMSPNSAFKAVKGKHIPYIFPVASFA